MTKIAFGPSAAGILLAFSGLSAADWQIDQSRYNAYLCTQVRVAQACAAPARVGQFATRQECEAARTRGHLGSDQQWLMRTQCVGFDRPLPAARSPSPPPTERDTVPRADNAAEGSAGFEAERRALLAKLKGNEQALRGSPAEETRDRVLRELRCAAYWALVAARETAAGSGRLAAAREAAQHGMHRSGLPSQTDCPRSSGAATVPVPQANIERLDPEVKAFHELYAQSQSLQSKLVRQRALAFELAAERERRLQALERLREQPSDKQSGKDEAARRQAESALAAVEQLERELAQLERRIEQSEAEQRNLLAELDSLEQRYRSLTTRRNEKQK